MMAKRKTRKQRERAFIQAARKKHGDRYDYQHVNYVVNNIPVTIICPIHGEFQQQPSNHAQGKGCIQCARDRLANSLRMTEKEMLSRAAKAHPKKGFKYELSNYDNQYSKITISCPRHGEFKQDVMNHLRGAGCPKCANAKSSKKQRLTTEQFIARARQLHGDAYEYGRVRYVKSHTKVTIICKVHGPFSQTPNSHLNPAGCPKCGQGYKSKDEFIIQSISLHAEKYSYEKVRYTNLSTKVTITCPIHGPFRQTPSNHLVGRGCPTCGDDDRKAKKRDTNESFIKKALAIHGNVYDYKDVKCKNHHTKVKIICPQHGLFEQSPSSHLNGSGCPKCGLKLIGERLRMSKKDFVAKARAVHGKHYDYRKVKYTDCKTNVTIICPRHGSFEQTPDSHIHARGGCPRCSDSVGVKRIKDFLTLNGIIFETEKRFAECRDKLPLPFDFYLPGRDTFIEYHGQHHYFVIPHWHRQYPLKERQRIDRKKERFAKQHGKYICIPYWDSHRIVEILDRKL